VGTLLVGVHQTRIADDINGKDRRQSTFKERAISSVPSRGRAQILVSRPNCRPSHRHESASGQQSGGKSFG
jgi:hypothetical protein